MIYRQETRDRLKSGQEDGTMPFFNHPSELSNGEGQDTLGKKKPPPVPPKGYRDGMSDEDSNDYVSRSDRGLRVLWMADNFSRGDQGLGWKVSFQAFINLRAAK